MNRGSPTRIPPAPRRLSRGRMLGAVAALAAVVGIGLAAGPLLGGPAAAPDAARGKKLFSTRCVACHKRDGSGGVKLTGNATPDWRDARRMSDSTHTDAYLRDCITNGKPKSGMPTWGKQLKPRDVNDLIAYIRTFSQPDSTAKKKSSSRR